MPGSPSASPSSRAKELWLRQLDATLGQRYLLDFVRPGGVARDAEVRGLAPLAECARALGEEACDAPRHL